MSDFTDSLKNFFIGPKEPEPQRYLSYFGMVFWGALVLALGAALVSAILNLWPVVDFTPPADADAPPQEPKSVGFLWGAFSLELTKSNGLVVLAFVSGALGGWTSAARLFSFWAGRRELKSTWAWWFGNRVFGGGALALIVYLMIRAGLFGTDSATNEVNAYGTAAFSGLVGLFSRQALDKLQEVFKTLFQPKDAPEDDAADGEAQELDQGQPTKKQATEGVVAANAEVRKKEKKKK